MLVEWRIPRPNKSDAVYICVGTGLFSPTGSEVSAATPKTGRLVVLSVKQSKVKLVTIRRDGMSMQEYHYQSLTFLSYTNAVSSIEDRPQDSKIRDGSAVGHVHARASVCHISIHAYVSLQNTRCIHYMPHVIEFTNDRPTHFAQTGGCLYPMAQY